MNIKILVALLIIAFISGCSTMRVPAKVTHPAEVDMTSHKKIAIMDIAGNYGDQMRDTIKARLASSGHFNVQNCASKVRWVETQEEVAVQHKKTKLKRDLDRAAAVINLFNSGKVDIPSDSHTEMKTITKRVAVKELPEECKTENLRVSAIIKGSYNGIFDTALKTTRTTCKKDKKKYPCNSYRREASVTVNGSIDVIDVSTGNIISTRPLNDVCKRSAWSTESLPRTIDERSLRNECVSRNASSFAKTLTPWTETVMVAYQKDGDLPQLEQGINLVKLGRYEQAIDIFSKAIATAERNMLKPKIIGKAYWNLGLAYEYSWEFDKALEAFNSGYLVHTDSKFLNEIRNTENLKMKREELLRQKEKQAFASAE